jgi:hypothetical protein
MNRIPFLTHQAYFIMVSKSLYLGLKRPSALPLPEYIGLTSASNPDLSAFQQISP